MKEKMLDWYQSTCDIVPFKHDQPISKPFLFESAKNQFSKEKYQKFVEAFEKNNGKMTIIELCAQFGLRVI